MKRVIVNLNHAGASYIGASYGLIIGFIQGWLSGRLEHGPLWRELVSVALMMLMVASAYRLGNRLGIARGIAETLVINAGDDHSVAKAPTEDIESMEVIQPNGREEG